MDFTMPGPVFNDHCNNQSVPFHIDEACLNIVSNVAENVTIWAQLTECDKCDLVEVATLPANGILSLLRKTQFPWTFQATVDNASNSFVLCNDSHARLAEHGFYGWNVSGEYCSRVYTIHDPPLPPFSPILAVLTLLVGLTVLWKLGVCCYNSDWLARLWPQNVPFSELQSDLGSPSTAPDADSEPSMLRAQLSPIHRSRCRVVSLDVFRGISISLMIFVNYGGGEYWFFKHSPWNGLTVADLVFPWFLWIMGSSLALSLRSQLRSSVPRGQLLRGVLRRSLTLVALGVALNSAGPAGVALGSLRLPGVLQRLGAAYALVAGVEVALMKPRGSLQYGRLLAVKDIADGWLQWLIVLSLVAAHLLVTFMLGVPGCPTGYLGPGGTHDHARYANCTGGAAGYIDRQVFGWSHIYQHPTCKRVYSTTMPYDPEGLLGTLTAVLTVYLGVQSGRIIMSFNYTAQRIRRWLVWATITGVTAGVLCNFSKNDGVVPVNKNLTSVSFVLALGSMAFVLQSVLYLVVDEKKWWGGEPFKYPGMNAIVVYVGHEVTRDMFPWSWRAYYGTHWEHTLMDAWGTALWILIAYALYRRKIFLAL